MRLDNDLIDKTLTKTYWIVARSLGRTNSINCDYCFMELFIEEQRGYTGFISSGLE